GRIADKPGQTFWARLDQLDKILRPRTQVPIYLPGHLNGLRENPSVFYRTSQGSYRVLFGSPPTLNALPMASGCASQTLGAVWGIPVSDQRLLTTLFHMCIPLPFYLQLPTSSAQTHAVPLTPTVSGTLYASPNEPGYEDIVWRQDGWTLIDTGYVGTHDAEFLSLARVTAADLSRTQGNRPLPGRHGAAVLVYGAPDAPSEATFQLGHAQYVIYANGYEALAWAQQMYRLKYGNPKAT
ncbi:MAG: hypothetical protein OWQ57_04390, partial [Sulfobacillus sp.]|nr:hypothetical protein [Sulfobacillus sp.]